MIIYKVTNTLDGKCYIGQTIKTLEKRKRCHISMSKRDNPPKYLHRAMSIYGVDNFIWEIICECESRYHMDEMEKEYISLYNSSNSEFGYNQTIGGRGYNGNNKAKSRDLDGRCGPRSDLLKQKISDNRKGKCLGNDNPSKRPDVKKKISESHIGRTNYNGGGPKGDKSTISKTVIITFPDGHEEVVTGIRHFATQYGLKHQSLIQCAKGNYSQTKGYKCRYIKETD